MINLSLIQLTSVITRLVFCHTQFRLTAFAGLVCLLGVGCESRYSERLERSADYFEFLDKMNQRLSDQQWSDYGFTLQVPKKFKLQSPPQAPLDAQGNPLPIQRDSRQPEFVPGGIPGLVGAWEATVKTDKNFGALAYIYVISNYEMWEQKIPAEKAVAFHADSSNQILTSLGIQPPTPGQWTDEEIPIGPSYVSKKQFRKITLPIPKPINEFNYDISIYQVTRADMQGSVITFIPQEIAASEDMAEKIKTSLMTFTMSGARPDGGSTANEGAETGAAPNTGGQPANNKKPPKKKSNVNF